MRSRTGIRARLRTTRPGEPAPGGRVSLSRGPPSTPVRRAADGGEGGAGGETPGVVRVDVEAHALLRSGRQRGAHGEHGERPPGTAGCPGAQVEDERSGGQRPRQTRRVTGHRRPPGPTGKGRQGTGAAAHPVGQEAGVRPAQHVGAGPRHVAGQAAPAAARQQQIEIPAGTVGPVHPYGQSQGVGQAPRQPGRPGQPHGGGEPAWSRQPRRAPALTAGRHLHLARARQPVRVQRGCPAQPGQQPERRFDPRTCHDAAGSRSGRACALLGMVTLSSLSPGPSVCGASSAGPIGYPGTRLPPHVTPDTLEGHTDRRRPARRAAAACRGRAAGEVLCGGDQAG